MSNKSAGYLEIDFPVVKIDGAGSLLKATLRTLFTNIGIVSKIVLTVFVPLELIKNYFIYSIGAQDNLAIIIRIEMLLESVFSSLTVPALIYALITVFRTGSAPSIRESFRWGFRQWARVFGNRWLAGMAMLGGLILLIIPGIVFAVWFVFVDAIVSIEGDKQPNVLRRSRKITRGHRWMLFFSGVIAFVLIFFAAAVSGLPLAFIDHWIISAVVDCLFDVVFQILPIMFLLAYLNFVSAEREAIPLAEIGR